MLSNTLPVFNAFTMPRQQAVLMVNTKDIPEQAETIAQQLARHYYSDTDSLKAMADHLYDIDDIAFASDDAIEFALCVILNATEHLLTETSRHEIQNFFSDRGFSILYCTTAEMWCTTRFEANMFKVVIS